jgi:hypothetical protein
MAMYQPLEALYIRRLAALGQEVTSMTLGKYVVGEGYWLVVDLPGNYSFYFAFGATWFRVGDVKGTLGYGVGITFLPGKHMPDFY